MNYSLNQLYQSVGISKQAVHQFAKRQQKFNDQLIELLSSVEDFRADHPGCGVEKMYYALGPQFLGRDRFVDIFMSLGFGVQKHKNYRRTTLSGKVRYPNLIQGMLVVAPSQVWQSDITYIEVGSSFYYAVFIIDIYTKKIVGYHVSGNMRASANLSALKMALRSHRAPMIHHSDRGSQYTSKVYINRLVASNCLLSMGNKATENAYAERINGTIKNEYLKHWKIETLRQLKQRVKKAVKNYNSIRPHNHLGKLSPIAFEKGLVHLEKPKWPKVIVYADGQNRLRDVSNIPQSVAEVALQVHVCPI